MKVLIIPLVLLFGLKFCLADEGNFTISSTTIKPLDNTTTTDENSEGEKLKGLRNYGGGNDYGYAKKDDGYAKKDSYKKKSSSSSSSSSESKEKKEKVCNVDAKNGTAGLFIQDDVKLSTVVLTFYKYPFVKPAVAHCKDCHGGTTYFYEGIDPYLPTPVGAFYSSEQAFNTDNFACNDMCACDADGSCYTFDPTKPPPPLSNTIQIATFTPFCVDGKCAFYAANGKQVVIPPDPAILIKSWKFKKWHTTSYTRKPNIFLDPVGPDSKYPPVTAVGCSGCRKLKHHMDKCSGKLVEESDFPTQIIEALSAFSAMAASAPAGDSAPIGAPSNSDLDTQRFVDMFIPNYSQPESVKSKDIKPPHSSNTNAQSLPKLTKENSKSPTINSNNPKSLKENSAIMSKQNKIDGNTVKNTETQDSRLGSLFLAHNDHVSPH